MPRWSPDGSRLAFLSDRARRGQQLYLLDAGRPEQVQPTPDIEGTVEYLAWSPNGQAILLGVAGPGADIADARGAGATATHEEGGPSWMPRVDNGVTANHWRRLWLYDIPTGQSHLLTPPNVNVWEAAWAGDGRIVATVSDRPREGAWYDARLATIDVATGDTRIVYASPRQLSLPTASPSGDQIAVIQALCSDRGLAAGDVLLFGRDGAAPRALATNGVDVTHLAWRDEPPPLLCRPAWPDHGVRRGGDSVGRFP